MTRLFVDSTYDIPGDLIEKYGIGVLPLHVLIGETEYLDGVTIQTNEVYDYMRQGIMPKTSQIEYEATENAFRAALNT